MQTSIRTTTKKKFALITGYIGTNFNGSQYQPPPLPKSKTVEGALHDALFKANLISTQNYDDITKVQMTRSSRTDKKVHSLCSVFGMKLDIDRELYTTLQEDDPLGFKLAEHVSQFLPEDIRVFSIQRAVNSFCARNSTAYRSYDYLIPLSLLKDGEQSVPIFEKNAELFIGNQCVLNCLSLQKESVPDRLKPYSFERIAQVDSLEEREQLYMKLLESKLLSDYNRFSTKMKANKVIEIAGEKFLVVELLANSYVYNQIRYMISAIISQTNGWVPENYITTLLGYPRFGMKPILAPPDTLMVNSCGQHVPIGSTDSRALEMNDPLLIQRQDSFRDTVVYPHLQSSLSKDNIFEQYTLDCKEYYGKIDWDGPQYQKLQAINDEWINWVQNRIDFSKQRDIKIRTTKIEEYHHNKNTSPSSKNTNPEKSTEIKPPLEHCTPNNLMMELCIRYNQLPFQQPVQFVTEYLTHKVLHRDIPLSLDLDSYFQYIDSHEGGFDQVVQLGKQLVLFNEQQAEIKKQEKKQRYLKR
jgi:tRNA pseudouridine(38-40) synthase